MTMMMVPVDLDIRYWCFLWDTIVTTYRNSYTSYDITFRNYVML